MKTCKTGCGKMKAGGSIKKMAKGGQALNKARGYAKPQTGGDNISKQIYGIPNAGTTGPNRTAAYDYKKGGSIVTAVKHSCPPGSVRLPNGKCGTRETPAFKKGGSTFGMLSVKAGVDNNPKPTAADRIAGAKMSNKEMKKGGSTDKKWIQSATASIKKRGTEGVCTGSKFGGPSCPPGSKRYNLAKTFKKIAKNR